MDQTVGVILAILIMIGGASLIFVVYKLSKKYYLTMHFKTFLYIILSVNTIAILLAIAADVSYQWTGTTTVAGTTTAWSEATTPYFPSETSTTPGTTAVTTRPETSSTVSSSTKISASTTTTTVRTTTEKTTRTPPVNITEPNSNP